VVILVIVALVLYAQPQLLTSLTKIGRGENVTYPVFHISGAPGSGKTFMGYLLHYRFPDIHVVDLDSIIIEKDLFHRADSMIKKGTVEEADRAGLLFKKELNAGIQKIMDEYKHKCPVVFVGLATLNYGNKLYLADTILKANYKYYIDLHPKIITEQRLWREVLAPLCGNKKNQGDVVEGRVSIHIDRVDIENGFWMLKDFYVGIHKYSFLTQRAIEKDVTTKLKELGYTPVPKKKKVKGRKLNV
jgi:hypothetical protein